MSSKTYHITPLGTLSYVFSRLIKGVVTTYPSVVSFLTFYPPVVYSVNAPLPTSQSAVTLTRLIPKSKNKTDQILLSPSNTHSLSVSRLLTHWGCHPLEFLDPFMLGILWVISSKETLELLNYWFRVLIVTNPWFFVNKLDLDLIVFLSIGWVLDFLSLKFFFFHHLLFSPYSR